MNGYIARDLQPSSAPARSCPVPGYSQLSAGAITVSGPNGSATVTPNSAAGSNTYSLNLPAGFITGNTYNIFAAGGATVGTFQGSIMVDAPIQITAVDVPGIFASQPITVQWTGGAATSVVKVSLVYKSSPADYIDYGYTPASAGSYSFQPICSGNPISAGGNGVYCSFGLPGLSEVVVEQMPAAG